MAVSTRGDAGWCWVQEERKDSREPNDATDMCHSFFGTIEIGRGKIPKVCLRPYVFSRTPQYRTCTSNEQFCNGLLVTIA